MSKKKKKKKKKKNRGDWEEQRKKWKKKYEESTTASNFDRVKLTQGKTKIRILSHDIEDVAAHYIKGKNEDGEVGTRRIVCLGNEDCPICEMYEKTGDVKYKAKYRYYMNAINRKEDELKAQILDVPKSVWSEIAAYATDEDYGDPTTYDFKIIKKGEGRDTRYKVLAGKTSPLTKDEKRLELHDLSMFNTKLSREEILNIIGISEKDLKNMDDEEDEDENVDNDEKESEEEDIDEEDDEDEIDDEDEEDDEEDDEEKEDEPKKKKKKGKIDLEDEDENDEDLDEDENEEDED